MGERDSVQGDGSAEYRSLGEWASLAILAVLVVWIAFDPMWLTWDQVFGGMVVLSTACAGVGWALRRLGRSCRWAARIPSPVGLARGLVSRLGVSAPLLNPRWAKVRLAAVGFLVLAALSGYMGWGAGQEDQMVQNLREHGQTTVAIVVSISGRSEEGRANSLAVRFSTPYRAVRAEVDVGDGWGDDERPGGHVPVVYDPSDPTKVRHAGHVDGSEADGMRTGAVVFGLLAAAFLVATVRESTRARVRTTADEASDSA